jgi:hypothetical protein
LSFQCLRLSTALRAAGKNILTAISEHITYWLERSKSVDQPSIFWSDFVVLT